MPYDTGNNEDFLNTENEYFSELPRIPKKNNNKSDQNISTTGVGNSNDTSLINSDNLPTIGKNAAEIKTNNEIDEQFNTEFKTEIYQSYNIITQNTIGSFIPTLNIIGSKDTLFDLVLIRKAFQSHECDKEIIRNILARRTSNQRAIIQKEYEKNYSETLIGCVKSNIKDPYQRILISLLYIGSDLDAYMIHQASKGIGTDELIYRLIICTRSYEQISLIKESYQKIYKQSLESQIRSETSGHFLEMMLDLINKPRIETKYCDVSQVIQDVMELISTSVFEFTTPNTLIHIFGRRSYTHLLRTFYEYNKKTEHSVNKYLKKFIKSDYQKCLISIYHFIRNPVRFFTKFLNEGIQKKNIYHVTFIVVTRCEIDLKNILEDYKKKYNTDFLKDLTSVFISHEYKDILETISILCGES